MERSSVRINLAWDSRNKVWRVWATATLDKGAPRVLGPHKVAHTTAAVDKEAALALVALVVAELESRLF